jgi:prepilin-type N-terminal cleavage/methylation domain-containing protein
MPKWNLNNAFTLAEILIVLAIVGVVAGLVIPTIVNDTQNEEYKTGYKKAYADASMALKQILADNEYVPRTGTYDWNNTLYNWNKFQDKFNVQKDCSSGNRFDCWEQNGDCAQGTVVDGVFVDAGECSNAVQMAFLDNSGRSWTLYSNNEITILVDVNGFKPPNRLGKDRWPFCYADMNNKGAFIGTPVKVLPNGNDITSKSRWCPLGSCYFSTWLFGVNGAVKY